MFTGRAVEASRGYFSEMLLTHQNVPFAAVIDSRISLGV